MLISTRISVINMRIHVCNVLPNFFSVFISCHIHDICMSVTLSVCHTVNVGFSRGDNIRGDLTFFAKISPAGK